jgi:hypothetical protein
MVLRVEVEVGRDNQQPEAVAVQKEEARLAAAAVQKEAEDQMTEVVVPMDEVESYLAVEEVGTEDEVGSNLLRPPWEHPIHRQQLRALLAEAAAVPIHSVLPAQPVA